MRGYYETSLTMVKPGKPSSTIDMLDGSAMLASDRLAFVRKSPLGIYSWHSKD